MKNTTKLQKMIARNAILEAQNRAYEEKIRNIEEKVNALEQENDHLREQVRLLQRLKFEKKTEKKLKLPQDALQFSLFNEAEAFCDEPVEENEPIQLDLLLDDQKAQKKRGRRHIADDIPRVDDVIDIREEEKRCACGAQMVRIGEQVSEKLEFVPAKIRVRRFIRYKYACRNCEGTEDDGPTVRIAPMPPQLISQGIVTPSLLSYLLINKFADALPLYRQSNMLGRFGVDIPRSTMSEWVLEAARACAPLLDRLYFHLRKGPAINMDETPVQVLKEQGRENTAKSCMWVARGGLPGRNVVLFSYAPSRSGREIPSILGDFKGFLQTDGYKGYEGLEKVEGITHVGCLAHVRRKFVDAAKAGNKKISGTAAKAVELIGHIYRTERLLREKFEKGTLTQEQFLELRKQKIGVMFDAVEAFMKEAVPKVLPSSLLGKALSYGLKQWSIIRNYLDCPWLTPDNNAAENALRPFVVGRKNWLFAGSPRGASASALFYSLIESARANGLNIQDYLWQALEKLPYAKTEEELEALMPWAGFPDKNPV